MKEGKVSTGSTLRPKPKPKKKRKSSGQAALFRKIWDKRPHRCITCSTHIHEARAENFSHVLPKGAYPEYKLDERNVVLQCGRCHQNWHIYGKELRELRGWSKFFQLYDDLWEEMSDKYEQSRKRQNEISDQPEAQAVDE